MKSWELKAKVKSTIKTPRWWSNKFSPKFSTSKENQSSKARLRHFWLAVLFLGGVVLAERLLYHRSAPASCILKVHNSSLHIWDLSRIVRWKNCIYSVIVSGCVRLSHFTQKSIFWSNTICATMQYNLESLKQVPYWKYDDIVNWNISYFDRLLL